MSNDHPQIDNEAYRTEDVNDVTEYMYKFIHFKFIGYVFTFVFIIFIASIQASILIVVIPSLTAEVFILIILFGYQIKSSKYLMTFAIIECFFDIIFKVFVIICTRNDYSKIYSLSIAIIHLLLNFLSCKDQTKALFLPQLFLINIIFYLFALFIFLRVDGMVSWRLQICLWPAYIYLGIIFLLGFFKIKEFLIFTIKLSCITCNNVKKYLSKNFEFISCMIFLSTHILSIYIVTTNDNYNINSVTQFYPILINASIPLLCCFFVESSYLILSKNKIKKYLKNFIFFSNRNVVNVGDNPRPNPDTNEVLHTEHHQPDYNSDSHSNNEFRSENNDPAIINNEKAKMKKILKNYIKHYLPNHLIKKTSCYYIPGYKKEKVNEILQVNPIKVNRRVISQTFLSQNIPKTDSVKSTPVKKSQRTTSFTNINIIQIKDNDKTEKNNCLMCCENVPNAVFMECGHGGMCYTCCIKMWKSGDECHICRGKISEVLQIEEDKKNKGKFSIISATFTLDNEKINKFKHDYENELINKKNNLDSDRSSSENRDVNVSIIDI